jgi:hypothetical protein
MTGSNRNLLQPDLILRLIASVHNISPSAKLNFIVWLQIFVTDIRHSQHMTCNTIYYTICNFYFALLVFKSVTL